MLSPNLQKKDTIEGKDINLATPLNPLYDCPTKHLVVANGIEVSVTGKHDRNLYHAWKITRSFPRTHVRTYYSFLKLLDLIGDLLALFAHVEMHHH
jgi:hypothetical protein